MDTNSKNETLSAFNRNQSKKFVFMIYPENIKGIESLSYDEKNVIINELISDYFKANNNNKLSLLEMESAKNKFKKTVLIIIAIPVIIALASLSLHFTQQSYLDMQNKFQKLYDFSQKK